LSCRSCREVLCELDLPDRPFIVGRDYELVEVVKALMNGDPSRIAILGPPGIGKTTLAAAILRHEDIKARYRHQRYFVQCDEIESVDLLLINIAKALRIPMQRQRQDLRAGIFTFLGRNRILLCLDNLETPWEKEQGAVENILKHMADMPNLAILVTMRGVQRPAADKRIWKPLLPPLEPLEARYAAQIFKEISGKEDEFTEKMAREVEYVPLAVRLLATLAQEGENTEALWKRWNSRHTAMLENGGEGRLSKLDVSIRLSVESERMRRDPMAIQILALLAFLPDGFDESAPKVDRFNAYLNGIDLGKALQTLTRTSLAFRQGRGGVSRVQLLSTIRYYVLANVKAEQWDALLSFYLDLVKENEDYTQEACWFMIYPELVNLQNVLMEALGRVFASTRIGQAAILYTRWAIYVGSLDSHVIQLALRHLAPYGSIYASCLNCAGSMYMMKNELDEAKKAFENAMQLHKQAKDVLGEANDLQCLGDVHMRKDELDEAEKAFENAMQLHKQAKSVLGEADDLQNLGEVHMRKYELDEAEKAFENAIQLHKQAKSVLGEANDLQNLGDVHMRKYELDEAEKAFENAIQLHKQAKDVLGEAYDLQCLGEVYMRKYKLDEAKEAFENAIQLHKQAKDVLGEANDLQNLGEVHMRKYELDEAEKAFENSIQLHKQAKSVLGEANDLQSQREMSMMKDELDEAEKAFGNAIQLYKQAKSVLGEANDLHWLGEVYMRKNELDKAEKTFENAIQFHKQAKSVLGEAYDLQKLGEVHMRKDELDEAEKVFENAVQLHKQAKDVLGEANDLQNLGKVYMRKDELDEAEKAFQNAVQLHKQAKDVLGEANDFHNLGKLCMRKDDLNEAKKAFEKAIQLHKNIFGRRNDP
jgi:cytochrome c-type biogenesis protein CcmH/NrfG